MGQSWNSTLHNGQLCTLCLKKREWLIDWLTDNNWSWNECRNYKKTRTEKTSEKLYKIDLKYWNITATDHSTAVTSRQYKGYQIKHDCVLYHAHSMNTV